MFQFNYKRNNTSSKKSVDIVFIQQQPVIYFGILSLANYLQYRGYTCGLIITTLEKDIIKALAKWSAAVVGITAMTNEHRWLLESAREIKKYKSDALIIAGGIHGILYANDIIADKSIDCVCNSEGEEVLVQLIEEIKTQKYPKLDKIKGIVFRNSNGNVISNERADLVNYRNDIIENKMIYWDSYPKLARDKIHRFISSRGCPYECSFCYNATIKGLFRGKGHYVRQKNADNIIQEILNEKGLHKIESIYFFDDLFTFNKKWLKYFISEYKRKINLPFMCTTRADIVDDETARMLRDGGCITCTYGVETGNYGIRNIILNKNITNDTIINCGTLLNNYKIWPQTSNMFCLPDESVDNAFETVDLNIKAKTRYAFSSIFLPFPGTKLAEYCINKGYLPETYNINDVKTSFLKTSVLNMPDKDIIINIQRLIFIFVRYPKIYNLLKRVVFNIHLKPVCYLFFLIGNFIRIFEGNGEKLISSIRYAWRLKKSI